MKKIIFLIVFAMCGMYTMAQDEGVLQLYIAQKKWESAKEEVDKMLANPKLKDKDKASAYLWKLTVYSQLYADSSLTTKYADANEQAYKAYTDYVAIDPSLKQLREQNFAGGLGNLYSASFERGKNYFQNKDWENAYKYFSEAERIGNILLVNKLSNTTAAVDTVTVLYAGYSAQNAQHQDSAAMYYGKLADIKIAGSDYEDIYKYLIQYYSEKKDDANFKKYLAIAKELYPNDNSLWTQFEMSNMTSGASLTDLLQKYQQDVAAGGMNEDKYTGYAEALATTDKLQLDKLDSMQKINIKMAAAQAFSKAFDMNNSNGLYAFNTGVIYYSIYGELDDRYSQSRGEGSALKAKRAEIAKQEMMYADTASQWLEKAYTLLKAKTDRTKSETTSLNRTVDYLANIYIWQRDQTKTNGNSKDYDKYDVLYKKYDQEHSTYK